MARLNIATLNVHDQVGVISNQASIGIFTVTKINKMKAVMTRNSDGYTILFSAKTGKQLPNVAGGYYDAYAFVESVADTNKRHASVARAAKINNIWRELHWATDRRDIADVRRKLAELDALIAD